MFVVQFKLQITFIISYFNRDFWLSLQFIENDATGKIAYRMFFLGRNFVFCAQEPTNLKRTLKTFKNVKTQKPKKNPKTLWGLNKNHLNAIALTAAADRLT